MSKTQTKTIPDLAFSVFDYFPIYYLLIIDITDSVLLVFKLVLSNIY